MRDLTQHLTARADEPCSTLHFVPEELPVSRDGKGILAQVRFLAYHRIKPHAPPLVRTPVNSFEFQSCDRTPQVEDLTLFLATGCVSPTASLHRLQRGLPGYLILFAPTLSCLSVSLSIVSCLRYRCSLWYLCIHRYTINSAYLYCTQDYQYQWHFYG